MIADGARVVSSQRDCLDNNADLLLCPALGRRTSGNESDLIAAPWLSDEPICWSKKTRPDFCAEEPRQSLGPNIAGDPSAKRCCWKCGLCLAFQFRDPPSRAHEQETPIVKKFWRLALKSVPDELKDPANYE